MDDLVKKLRSQIGDDVQYIYDHEYLFKASADRIDALTARAAELETVIKRLVALNDDYSPFGGEMYQDRVDRAWDAARAALAKT